MFEKIQPKYNLTHAFQKSKSRRQKKITFFDAFKDASFLNYLDTSVNFFLCLQVSGSLQVRLKSRNWPVISSGATPNLIYRQRFGEEFIKSCRVRRSSPGSPSSSSSPEMANFVRDLVSIWFCDRDLKEK